MASKEITVREFTRNFRQVRGDELEVTLDDEVIGVWKPTEEEDDKIDE